ncbi:MAG TPA: HlyD family efflux transporter periplasmic adaptor subunit, partial [Planctomycetota bacterium]
MTSPRQFLLPLLKVALPILVLVAGALGAQAMIAARQPVARQDIPTPPTAVEVVAVHAADHPVTVRAHGEVRARRQIDLMVEVAGKVRAVSPDFEPGAFFAAGELLVEIDPRDYELALVRAQAQSAQAAARLSLEEAEAEVALREWERFGTGAASALVRREPQLAEARAAVAAAHAATESARRDLDRTSLHAPFAGRVRTRAAEPGQFLPAGAVVGRVHGIEEAELFVPVPESELSWLA